MEIANALKETRKAFGYTQSELSKTTGIPQSNLSAWEKGTNIPNVEFCAQLAKFYGISIDELIGKNDLNGIPHLPTSTPTLPESERQLLDLFRAMTHSQQSRFIAYGEGIVGAEAPKIKA